MATVAVRTLADLKRHLRVGLVFRCEHHTMPQVSGRRRVTQLQTNGMFYEPLEGMHAGSRCWVTFPKAKHLRFNDDGGVTFNSDGVSRHSFTYHFDQEQQ